ncbi:ABC transporter I family member 11, chloroplastic isoform X2 [Syzygium oleosum]|uniref:ABC transporter I family member 11, chloroplastic isoform X2 n=1 Tax=Syzygium oleosum TaxID=219896 RepID=UPI0024B8EAC1|nr:ABC transporter I family member 11, chloroplastic isoform X2 [Syzygium oleosum]XP_056169670.1 ABC transporter I family member 11, chloroplastic isoform X2 [Syzygium oleosum]XP_056169671.1 ABC transporter I family member 11, chloroplastic isoform X2 [Syzygium oleosum]XP_056169672.1 ABC transporter I family member 11, chloroplastic isoform X2 [Syzygium oleosum]XP_056169673.1 ABC transporter I family member 11, chloroplastic isoform X2 [Syzygium oleosum]XP_056169675.1 ABC transporter I family 
MASSALASPWSLRLLKFQEQASPAAARSSTRHALLNSSLFSANQYSSPIWLRFGGGGLPRIRCDHSCFEVKSVGYHPPGTQFNLLKDVSFSLPEKSFGLIFGQSGSGKTTLLQLLAGLNKPTSGSICIQRYGDSGEHKGPPEHLSPEKVGIVFQFPERYFIADNVLDEITFGWPRQKVSIQSKEQLAFKLQRAFNWVGLDRISLDKDPHSLSGGYKRRLALAIQLVEVPDLLILDEPLAGLDWKARADVVKLLKHLKREVTILVVSHDLRELASLVDRSWRMEMGGTLREDSLPF